MAPIAVKCRAIGLHIAGQYELTDALLVVRKQCSLRMYYSYTSHPISRLTLVYSRLL